MKFADIRRVGLAAAAVAVLPLLALAVPTALAADSAHQQPGLAATAGKPTTATAKPRPTGTVSVRPRPTVTRTVTPRPTITRPPVPRPTVTATGTQLPR
ncbi:hypothetical protein [Streptomyces sp. S1]|uniref:hypothetical protein n=1 Tax=Streptomyces sp. S1 TaxID=718288 RepID=UPI003D740B0B